jgi:hypothetical protein
MVSTFIAAMMRISASVDVQQVLAVILNMTHCSDVGCRAKLADIMLSAFCSLVNFNWNVERCSHDAT